MKSKTLMLTGILFSLAVGLNAQITPQEAVQQMGRGINLGNTLEPPTEGGWNNPNAEESYFDAYVEAGFNTIRIPVTWDKHVDTATPFTVQESWLDRVEEVVDWGLSRDMFVIFNAHHESWLKENYDDETARARFDSIWSQISVRFKGKPEKLFFEMLNEPRTADHTGLTQTQIDELNQRILGIIRKDHPTRIVIYSGKGWSSSDDLMNAAVPDDPYIMAYFHSYDPWNFAGEGNGTWGTEADRNTIRSKFAQVREWADQNSVEVLLGEFGAVAECDYNSRMVHYATYVKSCLKYHFAFATWDDGGSFEVLRRDTLLWQDSKDILIHSTLRSPDNLAISVINDSSLLVNWTPNEEGYDTIIIERRINHADFIQIATRSGEADTFLDTLTKAGNEYTYRVIAVTDTTENYSYPVKQYLVPTIRTPFSGSPIPIPGTIEAENYDIGGEGLTYHETTAQNIPGAYRPDESVDVEERNSGGYQVSYVDMGEWFEFSVNVAETGTYAITTPVASMDGGGKFMFRFPGRYSKTITAPKTDSWQTTSEVTTKVELVAGEQIMRVEILSMPPFNLDKFVISNVTAIDQQQLNTLELYPNPAGELLYISSAEKNSCSLKIMNTDGIVIKRTEHISINSGIDISDLSPGLYLLQIESGNRLMTRSFLKQ